jgi:flagellar L-ring protein precursor FlgH
MVIVQCFSTSLWSLSQNEKFKNLYSDNKAFKVGDIVTILVVEAVDMSQKDSTENKTKGLITSTLSIIKSISNIDLSKFLPSTSQDSGSSNTSSTNNSAEQAISAKIAAVITQIDTFGNLILEGKKEVKVGQDRRELLIRGIVRPNDVTADNMVDSYKIADAKIWYNGDIVFQQDPSEDSWVGYILSGLSHILF